MKHIILPILTLGVILTGRADAQTQDPLPSWNETATKAAIIEFVEKVSSDGSPDFVPPEDRIATFDNDGTLWCEQPIYTQLAFAFDRVKALAPEHPEWKTKQPYKAVLDGDLESLKSQGEKGVAEIIAATHAGMTSDEFAKISSDWIATAKHPRFKRPYTECVYQPQLELLAFLRDNGFQTFIVSGGGIEFMRPWTARVYGIAAPQVVGSSIVTEFQMQNGKPVLMRLPKVNFVDDKAGKPVGIGQHIGKRPILAFGNSAGDREMLQYATGGDGARLGLLVYHDDAEREYAYGPAGGLPDSKMGTFPQSLMDEAGKNGWIVVRMKEDWNRAFP
ncbi:haloacid dehalogenase-like hydrolase [Aeoliella sp. ICT_H6.2]|uniref:Haloacid dehalogenase-like hydrolase n=1 Tax=Aeoliella straminimaris TaxID=2954799 RepID=A0A9X2FEV2_9BACT|nr:HAD family hydrolase [Aeoliella straminimaris]MCO6046938.1 haloacid dehalogenase-like hydrolase [Aeoliella straminimaris]